MLNEAMRPNSTILSSRLPTDEETADAASLCVIWYFSSVSAPMVVMVTSESRLLMSIALT